MQAETHSYQVCAKCGQYIHLECGHYDVLETPDQVKHYVHHDFCSGRYQEDNSCTVVETHVNRR